MLCKTCVIANYPSHAGVAALTKRQTACKGSSIRKHVWLKDRGSNLQRFLCQAHSVLRAACYTTTCTNLCVGYAVKGYNRLS